MVGPGPQIWQGSQNWYPYPRQTSVWRVSPVINSFPRDERNRPGLQLCSPYKSVLCFFNPIPTSGYTYCAKNVSILLGMFAFQNMGQPQGKSPHKYHAFEKNQCRAFPYLPKMKINVPNHTSLEALHAHELGSWQARKKRILQRDGEDCVGNPENKRIFWLPRKGGFQSWEEQQGSQESGHLVQPDFLSDQEHVTQDLWASLLHLGIITSVSMAVVILGTRQSCLFMCL